MPKLTGRGGGRVGELPRGRVTFLLTDVVGSTRRWERDPAGMALALEDHDRILADGVSGHGGVLLKTKGEGDSTFSVFGGAVDGARAALQAQRGLSANRWPGEGPLVVRMSLHTGEAVPREGDYFGPTVNRAARLRAIAEGGEILLSQAAADLVVLDPPMDADLVALGQRELRDLDRPEQVYRLRPYVAATRVSSREQPVALLPFPTALAAARLSFFVGRGDEVERIVAAGSDRSREGPRAVLVSGEPGVGKTRVVAEATARLHEAGATVLLARCDENLSTSYSPMTDVLKGAVSVCPPGALASLETLDVAALARLVPEVAARRPVNDGFDEGEVGRDRLFAAIESVLAAVAATTPLVVVLDDLHWATQAGLVLLRHILFSRVQVFVIATYRDTEVGSGHPLAALLADLRRHDACERMSVCGLDERGILAYLEAAGYEPDARASVFARTVLSETDGNPFFVGELLAHLAETGSAYQVDGRWVATDARTPTRHDLPSSVREVVDYRLERLGDDARALLAVAAIIGARFDYGLVEEVLAEPDGPGPDRLLDALDGLLAARLLLERGDGRSAFVHALVRQAVLSGQSQVRRARLHLRVARVLESRSVASGGMPPVAELAHHYLAAGTAGLAPGIEYAVSAGELAMQQLAFEEAVGLFEDALEGIDQLAVSGAGSRRLGVLLALGEARWRASDYPSSRAAFADAAHLACRVEDRDAEALAGLGFGGRSGFHFLVAGDTLVELLEAVLSREPPCTPALRARVLARLAEGLTLEPHGRTPEEVASLAREALVLAEDLEDPVSRATVLLRATYALWSPDDSAARLARLGRVLELGEREAETEQLVSAHLLRYSSLVELADPDNAAASLKAATAIAEAGYDAYSRWLVAMERASQLLGDGRLAEGEALAWDALDRGTRTNPSALQLFGTQLFVVRREQDRVVELHAPASAMVERHPDVAFPRAIYALLLCEAGRPDRARRELEPLAAAGEPFGGVARDVLWLGTTTLLAETCHHTGDTERAAALYQALLPYRARAPVLGVHGPCVGSVEQHLGLLADTLARPAQAIAHLEAAVAENTRIGMRLAALRSQLHLARLLAGKEGRLTTRAAAMLHQVESFSRERGLTLLERLAHEIASPRIRSRSEPHRAATGTWRARGGRMAAEGRARLTTRGRGTFARYVRAASDDELQRRFGSPRAQRALFATMARAFQAQFAYGFVGDIGFELRDTTGPDGRSLTSAWTLHVEGRATVRRGFPREPAASIRIGVPDFLRMLSGARSAVAIVEEGLASLEGDVILLGRLSEMFGGVRPSDLSALP